MFGEGEVVMNHLFDGEDLLDRLMGDEDMARKVAALAEAWLTGSYALASTRVRVRVLRTPSPLGAGASSRRRSMRMATSW